jgi:two-component system cell cycle response regulator DivK
MSAAMRRIMIIEDNVDNRLLLNAILGDTFLVTEHTNGPDGLAALATELPEIVLLDISLPGMDGVEVLRHIRADPASRQLPVIAFTAHAMSNDRGKYLGYGFDDYITKPIIDETILLDSIGRLLARVVPA